MFWFVRSRQLRIIPRDLRQQRHQGIAARFVQRRDVRRSCFERPAAASEKVNLPGCVETQLINARLEGRQQTRSARRTFAGIKESLRKAAAYALDVIGGRDAGE
jgi:hypothetical protein